MKIKISSFTFFALCLIFCTFLYWPSLQGLPIWDDKIFWFADPIMQSDFPYGEIWKKFTWPMSVHAQKFLLSLLHKNYSAYHGVNLLLHFVNSLLVYQLAKAAKTLYPKFIFLIFFLHPVCVISVAWMIQIKTLLCFFFAILSLLFFIEAKSKKIFIFMSYLFYLFAVLSKSAALPLPFVYMLLSYRKIKIKDYIWSIPYVLIILLGSYRLLRSPITQEMGAKVRLAPEQERVNRQAKIEKKSPGPSVSVPKIQVPSSPSRGLNLSFPMKSFYYYFWQPLIPLENAPVRGLNYDAIEFKEFLQLFFVMILFIITWKTKAFLALSSALCMLIPFYGFIPAPFMNITWVSDQHLYLALPAFILFWMFLLERVPWNKKIIIPLVLILFFSYKTWQSASFYKNEIVFYEESLKSNPVNVPISYNLAYAYLRMNDWNEAYNIVGSVYELGKEDPVIRQNEYFPLVVQLYFQMQFPQRSEK